MCCNFLFPVPEIERGEKKPTTHDIKMIMKKTL